MTLHQQKLVHRLRSAKKMIKRSAKVWDAPDTLRHCIRSVRYQIRSGLAPDTLGSAPDTLKVPLDTLKRCTGYAQGTTG